MSVTTMKSVFGATILAAGLAASGAASAITLNTTGLQANSKLTFSVAAFGASSAAGITFQPLANMTKIGDITVIDPESGLEEIVPQFNQPVTKADVSIGWDLKITANYGLATRSVLKINRGSRSAALANFTVDFKAHVLYADVIVGGVTTTKAPIYTFVETVPQKISFPKLVLNQSVTIGELRFTPEAQTLLGDALALSAPLRASLAALDFGKIEVLVTSFKRSPAVSDKPFTAADLAAVAP